MVEVKVLSYDLLQDYNSDQKIKKILSMVKKNTIVMFEGRLDPQEETDLISSALGNLSGKFTGVEIAFLDCRNKTFISNLKNKLASLLVGKRIGITVVGPSKIIKEIKMNPDQLDILSK